VTEKRMRAVVRVLGRVRALDRRRSSAAPPPAEERRRALFKARRKTGVLPDALWSAARPGRRPGRTRTPSAADRPQMAPQVLEKMEFALERGAAGKTSDGALQARPASENTVRLGPSDEALPPPAVPLSDPATDAPPCDGSKTAPQIIEKIDSAPGVLLASFSRTLPEPVGNRGVSPAGIGAHAPAPRRSNARKWRRKALKELIPRRPASPALLRKHPALADVLRLDRGQAVDGDVLIAGGEQAVRLAQAGAVEGVADRAGVGEQGLRAPERDIVGERWAAKRMKALRFHLIGLPGRVISHARRWIIRLGGGTQALATILDARQTIRALAHGPAGRARTVRFRAQTSRPAASHGAAATIRARSRPARLAPVACESRQTRPARTRT